MFIQYPEVQIDVVDCPLLSKVPDTLVGLLQGDATSVLFADCCKAGQNPLGGFVQHLHSTGKLPTRWGVVAAPFTYNPLGSSLTFLNAETIKKGVQDLLAQ
jgi:hypothetical protein